MPVLKPVPQVLITLAPDGSLQAELPGPNGARRIVPITELESIRRILAAQLRQPVLVGNDSAPTSGQVKHWEEHINAPRSNCPWCIAASLGIDTSKRAHKRAFQSRVRVTATVTRLKPKSRKITSTPVPIDPADFGL